MSFVLTEEQELLKNAARDFAARRSPVSRFRALRDDPSAHGMSRDVWAEMAGLGWPAILIPEEHGGAGLGLREVVVVLEELGRNLVPEPLIPTGVLGAAALLLGGTDAQKKEVLPGVASGETLLALALQEPDMRFDPKDVALAATKGGDGWKLDGQKVQVWGGNHADRLVVAARTSGRGGDANGLTLFLVDAEARGVERKPQRLVDSGDAAIVELRGVSAGADAVLGEIDRGLELLDAILDRGAVALSAEMLGAAQAAFEMTLDYLKTRKQFGVLIGTFQALKHRAAGMFVELELSRSAVLAAADAIDRGAENATTVVAVTKAKLTETFLHVAREAVQMHGGIGMTDEHDVGFYLKRARVAEMTFGDASYHQSRFSALSGI